jgi:hypothetical protein
MKDFGYVFAIFKSSIIWRHLHFITKSKDIKGTLSLHHALKTCRGVIKRIFRRPVSRSGHFFCVRPSTEGWVGHASSTNKEIFLTSRAKNRIIFYTNGDPLQWKPVL